MLGVNSWHVSGADTRETRGVSTRAAQLLQFLDEAGVSPNLRTNAACRWKRASPPTGKPRSARWSGKIRNWKKLETADRLTRIAVVILMAGTLALFVAVVVLGAVVLGRRRPPASQAQAEHVLHQVDQDHDHAPRRRLGIVAVVLGATAAAVLVVMAGAALWRAQGEARTQIIADTPRFAGQISCTLDRDASVGAQGVSDMSFSASGALCVNERTLYAPSDGGRFQRAIVLGEARALDVLTIDPANGEFRRERYPLGARFRGGEPSRGRKRRGPRLPGRWRDRGCLAPQRRAGALRARRAAAAAGVALPGARVIQPSS